MPAWAPATSARSLQGVIMSLEAFEEQIAWDWGNVCGKNPT